jgi:chromosome segregation ATPase
MKKIITWLIAGIVAGLVGGYLIQSCRDAPLKKENAQLKADIALMRVVQTELEESSAAQISALLENIGTLQGNIDSLMTVNADLEADLENSRQDAAVLEAQAGILMAEVQPAIDANPKLRLFVGNLLAQIANGKDQIFTLTKQVETWKGAFANSELIGLDYKKGMDTYKALWEGEKGLRQKIEIRLNLQDKRVGILEGRIRLTSTVGVVGVGVALLAILLH